MNISPVKTHPIDDLTLQQFRSFLLTVDLGSYAQAARRLGVAVPTVWSHVQQLEQRYQSALFTRCGRGVVLTASGKVLAAAVRPLLDGFASTLDLIREHDHRSDQALTLLTGVRKMLEELGPPLRRFQQDFPAVSLRILHGDNRQAQELIKGGVADLALSVDPGPGLRAEGVHVQRAYPLEYLAVLPQRHRLRKRTRLRLVDILEEPLVLGTSDTFGRILFDQAVHRAGWNKPLHVVAETDNSASTLACVRAGLGVGLIAGRADGQLTRGLVTRSLTSTLGEAWIVFLWKEGRQLTLGERALIRHIRQGCQRGARGASASTSASKSASA